MIMTGMSDLFCLICDVAINDSSCVNICTSLLRNGESLANFVLRAFRPAILEFRSSYICPQCYNLFQMLEQAQYTVANIRCEILKMYQSRQKKIIKQMLQSNEHDYVENYDEYNKMVIDDATNQTKSILSLKSISNRIDIVPQTFSQNTILNRDLDVLNIDPIMNTNTTKVIKSTNVKKKENCFTKEYTSYHVVLDNTKSINSNSNGINPDIKKIKGYPKSLGINADILDHSLDNLTVLKRDHDVNDNNSVQRNMPYIQQCKYCTELFKSHNELHIHMLKHKNQKYQDSGNKMQSSNISKADRANDCIDKVAKAIITNSNLPQDNHTQEQNFLQIHEVNRNSGDTDTDAENSPRNGVDDITCNIQIQSDCAPTSWKSGRTPRDSSKLLEYSCATCGKKWKTSAELRTHIKTHSTLRPYMCEKCGQAYKHKHALEVHIGMHNGINPFQCNHCKKCFTQKGALMRHLPMHTGEMPYQCELCGKRFVHHTSYNMHVLSHTGKKSYQCNVCDVFLLSTSHLKRHMRVHTGERPYSCNLCGKRFAERYNLFAHRKIHDPDGITAKEKKKIRKKCEQHDSICDKKQELDVHSNHGFSDKNNEKRLIDFFNINDAARISENYTLHIQTQDMNTKKANSQDNVRLHNTNDQAKLMLLENSLSQIDTNSLITFNDQNFTVQNMDCETSSQVGIILNTTDPNTSHIVIEKAHT